MLRKKITPRANWQAKVETLGFGFHTMDGLYWDESVYYEFSLDEINTIEKATNDLWAMCLEAVQYIIEKKEYHRFCLPEWFLPHIERTWEEESPSVYGRLDFSMQNGVPKMLEFNADTPSSLFETGVVQWSWLESLFPEADQFNSVHEKLIAHWAHLKPFLHKDTLYFTVSRESLEDLTTVEYLRDCAIQGGLTTDLLFLDEIGWHEAHQVFKDVDDATISNIFKLYPWEWLVHDEFGKNIMLDRQKAHWIEPSWKMLLSNKAILPYLWQLFPNHPNLLPAYFDAVELKDYVKKPILSREGANVTIVKDNQYVSSTEGEYGEEGFVYQGLAALPNFDGNYALIGSWLIGEEAAGIGIRESTSMITDNSSRFVPHLIA